MDAVRTAVSYITFQRFYRFLLKRLLGGFLEPEFETHQLDVQLFSGVIQLVNVALNASRLNQILFSHKLPFSLESGRISKLRLSVPWRDILKDPCKVYVSDLELNISCRQSTDENDPSTPDKKPHPFNPGQVSIQAIAELVKKVLLNVEVCVDRVIVRVAGSGNIRFEMNDILLRTGCLFLKRLHVGESRLLGGCSQEALLSLSPICVDIDLNSRESSTVTVTMDSISVNASRRRAIESISTIIDEIRECQASFTDASAMFRSVIEGDPESRGIGIGTKIWYEEIYQVIETEVLRASTDSSLDEGFMDAIDEDFQVETELPSRDMIDSAKRTLRVSACIGAIDFSILGAEKTLPGISVKLRGIHLESKAEPSDLCFTVADYSIDLACAETDSSMFVSMMTSDDNESDASSVYESVVDSEESFAGSDVTDMTSSSLEHNREQVDSSPGDCNRELWFFNSEFSKLVRSKMSFMPSGLGGVRILRSAKKEESGEGSAATIILNTTKSVCAHLHSEILVELNPETVANLGLLSRVVSGSFRKGIITEEENKSWIDFEFTCPGLRFEIDLGNNHSMAILSDGSDVVFSSRNGGSFKSLKILTGDAIPVAVLSDVRLGFQAFKPEDPNVQDSRAEDDSSSMPWTAVGRGGRPNKKTDTKASVEEKESVPSLDLVSCVSKKEIVIASTELTITDSPIKFLDLQLKFMSLVDQIGMVNAKWASLVPRKSVNPQVTVGDVGISLFVSKCTLYNIRLINALVRVVLSENMPLVAARVGGLTVSNESESFIRPWASLGSFMELSQSPSFESVVKPRFDRCVRNAVTVDVGMKNEGGPSSITRICTNVHILGLQFMFDPSLVPDINKTIEFLAPSVDWAPLRAAPLITAPPRPTMTVVNLRVSESFVAYKKDSVLLLDGIQTSSGVVSTVDKSAPAAISVGIDKLSLLLNKKEVTDWDIASSACTDLVTSLRQRGLIPLASVTKATGIVKWRGDMRIFTVETSIGQIRLDLKADTYDGLSRWIGDVGKEIESLICKASTETRNEPTIIDLPPLSGPIPAARKFVINEDYVQTRTCGRGGSRFGRKPMGMMAPPLVRSEEVSSSSVGARWLVDPGSVVVVHDHLSKRSPVERRRLAEAKAELESHWKESTKGRLDSFTVCVDSVKVFIIDGFDWEGTEYYLAGMLRGNRAGSTCPSLVCVELDKLAVDIVKTNEDNWIDAFVSIGDLRIKDAVVGSVYQYVLGQLGARSGPDAVSIWFSQREAGKSKGEVNIAPLCITVDQDTLEFVSRFTSRVSLIAARRVGFETDFEVSLDNDVETNQSEVADQSETDTEILSRGQEMKSVYRCSETSFFQSFYISPVDVELNYKSKRISLSRLRKGDTLQLINLVPLLEGLRLHLSEIRMVDVVDKDDWSTRLLSSWSKDINRAQILKSLSSVTPIRSFTNLSASITDLVRQPLRQMRRKDGHLSRGVLRGISSFVRTLAIESLNLADVVVSGAQSALELMDSVTRSSNIEEQIDCEIALDDEANDEEWIPVEQGARQRAMDPSSAIEGLRTGSDALLRGVNVTRSTGAPGFILQPAIGAAEAVSVVIRGARSAVDSGRHHAETERKYKGPYVYNEVLRGT